MPRPSLSAAGLLLGLLLCLPPEAAGQQTQPDTTAADSTVHFEPYETDLSWAQHILAFPSTLLHYATRPVGSFVTWAEERNLLGRRTGPFWLDDDREVGVFPAFRIGGGLGFGFGGNVTHRELFGPGHEARLSALYGNTRNYRADLTFRNPAMFGPSTFLDADLSYQADSNEPLFLDGERPGETRTSFKENRADVYLEVGLEPRRGPGWSGIAEYHWVDVGQGTGAGAERFSELAGQLPGVGSTHLFSLGGSALLDMTRGPQPREIAGSRLYGLYTFTAGLDETLRYHRFRGEWQQFIPLPFPYPYRRLAFRTRLEKFFPLSGRDIPFYELSTLGNAQALRGFERNQFRDEGTLLFTLEYRYPIWDTWDALLFVDTGQAFDDFGDISTSDFRWAYGLGFRFNTSTDLSFRIDIGFTRQNWRAFATGGPNFTVTTRRYNQR